jgi:cytochrome c
MIVAVNNAWDIADYISTAQQKTGEEGVPQHRLQSFEPSLVSALGLNDSKYFSEILQ